MLHNIMIQCEVVSSNGIDTPGNLWLREIVTGYDVHMMILAHSSQLYLLVAPLCACHVKSMKHFYGDAYVEAAVISYGSRSEQ